MKTILRHSCGGLLCALLFLCALPSGARSPALTDLSHLDFSACRLIVSGGGGTDAQHLIAQYGDLTLYQYETEEETRNAFAVFQQSADFVETDGLIRAADGENESGGSADPEGEAPMTREDNPFAALEQALEDAPDSSPSSGESDEPLIALIDTGAEESLTEEAVSLIGEDPSDDNGHGTRMAQLILRENPSARILSVKAVGADGTGDISALCAAIEYAVERGADIINLSLGAPRKPDSAAIESALEKALAAGIRVVAAAGNQGQKASFYLPGGLESLDTIGAADPLGRRRPKSNYGPPVDCLVNAESTSEAAAVCTGILSRGEEPVPDGRMIFAADHTVEEGPAVAHQVSFYSAESGDQRDIVWLAASADNETIIEDGWIKTPLLFDFGDAEQMKGLGVYLHFMSSHEEVNITEECEFDPETLWIKIPEQYREEPITVRFYLPNDSALYSCALSEQLPEAVDPSEVRISFDNRDDYENWAALMRYLEGNTAYSPGYSGLNVRTVTSEEFDSFEEGDTFTAVKGYSTVADGYVNPLNVNQDFDGSHDVAYASQGQTMYFLNSFTEVYADKTGERATFLEHFGGVGTGSLQVNNGSGRLVPVSEEEGWFAGSCAYDEMSGATPVFTQAKIKCLKKEGNTAWFFYLLESSRAQYSAGILTVTFAPPAKGYAALEKHSTESSYTGSLAGAVYGIYATRSAARNAQRASMAAGEAVPGENASAVLTTRTNGRTQTAELTLTGSAYYAVELAAPAGFILNDTIYTLNLSESHTEDRPLVLEVEDEPVRPGEGYLKLVKASADMSITSLYTDYSVDNARYRVYPTREDARNNTNVLRNLYISASPAEPRRGESNIARIDLGGAESRTVYVRETSAPADYYLDETIYEVTVTADHTAEKPVVLNVTEVPKKTFARIAKEGLHPELTRGNPLYSLKGAVYGVYLWAKDARVASASDTEDEFARFTIGADGLSDLIELPVRRINGELYPYYVKEIVPPGSSAGSGYQLDNTIYRLTVSDSNTQNNPAGLDGGAAAGDSPLLLQLDLLLAKLDAETGGAAAQGTGSLAGARFRVRYFTELLRSPAEADAAESARTWVFETDEQGRAHFDTTGRVSGSALYTLDGEAVLPLGTLLIRETRAPKGYLMSEDVWLVTLTSAQNAEKIHCEVIRFAAGTGRGETLSDTTISADLRTPLLTVSDTPAKAGIVLEKRDLELEETAAQGDASLEGFVFTVRNAGDAAVRIGTRTVAKGGVVTTLTTDASGRAQTTADALPIGTYSVQETKSAAGYALDETRVFTVEVTEADAGTLISADASGAPLVFQNQVLRGGVSLQKTDSETGEAQGAATLAGAEFTIYNNSPNPVVVNGQIIQQGEAAAVLTTDENGAAQSAPDLLPYGSYYLAETRAPEGYALNTQWRADFQIREEGVIVAASETAVPEDILRADLSFYKVDMKGHKMAGIPFRVSLLDEAGNLVESHVIATDENGRVDTSARPKTGELVNALDELVRSGVIDSEDVLPGDTGLWFGDPAAAEEGKGALLYGRYLIQELRCAANEDQVLLTDFVFDANEPLAEVFPAGGTADLDNVLVDLPLNLRSDLVDTVTGGKTVSIGPETAVSDQVMFDHLQEGSVYLVRTEIYYRSPEGDVRLLGETEQKFTAEPPVPGMPLPNFAVNTVVVDTQDLAGGTLHAVDTFYVMLDGEPVQLARHNADLSVESQQLVCPETQTPPSIATSAYNAFTGTHTGARRKDDRIVDRVTLTSLTPGETYRVAGMLLTADGAPFPSEEAPVTAESLIFTAKEDTMRLDLTFPLDSSELPASSLVVSETLFSVKDENGEAREHTVAVHTNTADREQWVSYPSISTHAESAETGTAILPAKDDVCIIDTVRYENLYAGERYAMEGILVDAATGEPLIADGHGFISRVDFVPDTADGELEMLFHLDASSIAGKTVVVFEHCFSGDVIVAEHEDLKDAAQTLRIPRISTQASDSATGESVLTPGSETLITDVVTYENLIPGRTYTLQGKLMRRDTGVPLGVGHLASFTPEKPSGTMTLEFELDTQGLEGLEIVVFERLLDEYLVEIADHCDPDDTSQIVRVPQTPEETPPETPEETTVPETTPPEIVKTGDSSPVLAWTLTGAATLLMIGVLIVRIIKAGKDS